MRRWVAAAVVAALLAFAYAFVVFPNHKAFHPPFEGRTAHVND